MKVCLFDTVVRRDRGDIIGSFRWVILGERNRSIMLVRFPTATNEDSAKVVEHPIFIQLSYMVESSLVGNVSRRKKRGKKGGETQVRFGETLTGNRYRLSRSLRPDEYFKRANVDV